MAEEPQEQKKLIPASCTLCKYYVPDLTNQEGKGICRRHPPQGFPLGHGMTLTVWPTVEPKHWCGDGEPGMSHDSLQIGQNMLKGDKGNGSHRH